MTLKFSYFSLMARGLMPVLALELYGLEWEREVVENWGEAKPNRDKYPFGQLPVLFDGELAVAQTGAIANYIARKANMVPESAKDQATSDMLLSEMEVLLKYMGQFVPTILSKLEKGKEEGYIATESKHLPQEFEFLETLIEKRGVDGTQFTESGKSAGEIFLFGTLHQIVLVFPNILAAFPKLNAFYQKLLAEPKVQNALEGKSAFGEIPAYYVAAPPADIDCA